MSVYFRELATRLCSDIIGGMSAVTIYRNIGSRKLQITKLQKLSDEIQIYAT